jgi:hypothetical protein
MKKGDRVCYRVHTVSNTVGAHDAVNIYSRDGHLMPEKQKVSGGTCFSHRRFQSPNNGDFVASGTQAKRIIGVTNAVDSEPAPVLHT